MNPVTANVHYISRAIVAVNKKRDTDEITCWPVDLIVEFEDELVDNEQAMKVKGIDDNDKEVSVTIKRSATLNAVWGGEVDGQRISSPDVRRGERVDLYRVGDSEIIYWQSCGMDNSLRRLETIRYVFNANPSNSDAEATAENCYSYEINTHDGHVTFRTSMANGEPAAFVSQYNTAKGIYILEDEKGNHFYLDSVNTDITMQNASGTFIQLIEETMNINAVNLNITTENVSWENKNEIKIVTDTTNHESKTSYKQKTKATTWDSADTYKLTTGVGTMDHTGSMTATANGNIIINGAMILLN